MKMDESRINRTLEAVRSTGAVVSISGYSLGDMEAIVDDARKKTFDDAMQNAQDYASTFGFSLGKVTALMSPRSPDVEIDPPVEAGFPYGIPNRFWMEPFWGMSCDSEMGRFFDWMDISPGMAYADAYVRVAYELALYIERREAKAFRIREEKL
jgi:hypothetical protein